MFKKLLAKVGLGATPPGPPPHQGYAPYQDPSVNALYHMLFCDDLQAFRTPQAEQAGPPWSVLFASAPDVAALEAITRDESESRIQMLAYNRLRALGHPVPAKKLFGVIVEVRLDQGLDVVAAYPDGRARYLNQTGRASIFEGGPPPVAALARELVATAQPVVDQIGPWDKARLPPPGAGKVRMTFLVSDGLYFGEGTFATIEKDPMGGPVLVKAGQLLKQAVDTATKK